MLVPVDNGRFMGLNETEVSFINTDRIVTAHISDAGDYKWCQLTMTNGVIVNISIESFEKIMDAMIKNEKMA